MTGPWPNPPQLPSPPRVEPTVFPAAAAVAVDEHPTACPCLACTDALLARLRRPLVWPAPLTDPALTIRPAFPEESRCKL